MAAIVVGLGVVGGAIGLSLLCCACSGGGSSGRSQRPSPTPDPCKRGSVSITTNEDAEQLSGCAVYKGDIVISPYSTGQINLNGVGKVTGNLTAIDASQLSALFADSLASLGGALNLEGLTTLSSLDFPKLTSVKQLRLVSLPALEVLNFTQGLSKAKDVLVSNTGLQALEGIQPTAVTSLDINNNLNLQTIRIANLTVVDQIRLVSLPVLRTFELGLQLSQAKDVLIADTGLQDLTGIQPEVVSSLIITKNLGLQQIRMNRLRNINDLLSIHANAWSTGVEFLTLGRAGNLTFSNVSSLYVPALSQVEDSIVCYDSYFESFSAPNLTTVGSTLALFDNSQLSAFEFPLLRTIGNGILLSNNSQLGAITFDNLTAVQGDMNFTGTFHTVSFASLLDVDGSVRVKTSFRNQTICDYFDRAKASGIINGKVECSTGSHKPDLSKGAVAGISVGVAGPAIAAIALACIGVHYFCIRRGDQDPDANAEGAELAGVRRWLQRFRQRRWPNVAAANENIGPEQPDPPPDYPQALAEVNHEPPNRRADIEQMVEIAQHQEHHDRREHHGHRRHHDRREHHILPENHIHPELGNPAQDGEVDHDVRAELPIDRRLDAELYQEQGFEAYLRRMDQLERAELPINRQAAAELHQADNAGPDRHADSAPRIFEAGDPPSTVHNPSVRASHSVIREDDPPVPISGRTAVRRPSPAAMSIGSSFGSSETGSSGGMPLPIASSSTIRTPARAVVRDISDQTWGRHRLPRLPPAPSSVRRNSY